jgi:hypothetical protein
MSANTNPIYSRIPDIQWTELAAANTAKDGTGTVATGFTADATEGGRVEKVKVRAKGTNVATVLRFWINNGSTNATAANNTLIYELTIAATTLSETAQLADYDVALNLPMPPGYKLNFTIGTTIAAGIHVCCIGGKY